MSLLLALFGITPTPSSRLKYWNGEAWQAKTLKYWDGAAWQAKSLKYWDGSTWT